MRDDIEAWLRLTLSPGVLEASQRALLRAFGSPREALRAPMASVAGVVPPDVAAGLALGPKTQTVERALRWLEEPGHHLVALGDAAYPKALLQITDPPTVLYVIGRTELLNAPAFAIVGSRNATVQGMQDAQAFAQALSEAGLAIVSGLAMGIDAAAHRGGLAGPGSSVAIMGTGADRIYPKRNEALAEQLARQGALVSEFPLDTPPLKGNFPQRNRIISGLARGVLVVEAAPASGSLITVRCALDQNREVFAIPGSIHSALAKGCHQLIKDGAKLVECAGDVLEELRLPGATPTPVPLAPQPEGAGPESESEPVQLSFLDAMGFGPVTVDQLASATGHGAAEIAARLCELEIAGKVASTAGGRFQRLADRVIE